MTPPPPWTVLLSPGGEVALRCRLGEGVVEVSGGSAPFDPYVCMVPGQTITREELAALGKCFEKAAAHAADPCLEVLRLTRELKAAHARLEQWERVARMNDLTDKIGRYKLPTPQKEGDPDE